MDGCHFIITADAEPLIYALPYLEVARVEVQTLAWLSVLIPRNADGWVGRTNEAPIAASRQPNVCLAPLTQSSYAVFPVQDM